MPGPVSTRFVATPGSLGIFSRAPSAKSTALPAIVDFTTQGDKRSAMAEKRRAEEEHPEPLVNRDGVDLTQIRRLKAMTPTERVRSMVVAANNLIRLRRNLRRA